MDGDKHKYWSFRLMRRLLKTFTASSRFNTTKATADLSHQIQKP
jgi:hypothetical protein